MELKLVKGNMDKQDLIDEFFEKKCQVIKNAGYSQLVICNFVGIEALVEKALNKQVKKDNMIKNKSTENIKNRWISILREKAKYEHNDRIKGKIVTSPNINDVCNEIEAFFEGLSLNKLER